jgi:hypothetical protein
MREWACSFETVDPSDKSTGKHFAKWILDLIMHGIIPDEWPTGAGDEGELTLWKIDWDNGAIIG